MKSEIVTVPAFLGFAGWMLHTGYLPFAIVAFGMAVIDMATGRR